MKKLALVSALLVAISGTALAASETTTTTAAAAQSAQSAQMQNRSGFNDGSNPQSQQQLQQGKRDGKGREDCHRKDGKKRDDTKRGSFIDNNAPVISTSSVKDLKDNDRLVLEGFIEKQVGKEDYLFKDDSGSIEVEIDRRAWAGQEITPNDKVKLFGEVDKSWNKTEVEIHRVVKVQ
ncbi:YgiW/YdeI family stress tolerance OB fold protein [Testudinibacter sp. TR-2022]|uniref:YgiW/YdeI family stress tolerance OB fold protein n=1 Tax=Testudinibacter sp. TR-2022 TaxID=2585029 RepID=UPI0011188ED1|nr:NirD/YgiW/YdeI family stress tolerance protein [Testudinibacter sp. TR-2022]TNH06770.1 NirD/YgiW/YdeI family stress tolerance protein [Pasteurellaceae bacterium Phil11]TNH22513.1 NirD/YgiW/YdeI family stress tolerance protein [Testudinibacter sp. TR-2022]TNH28271.1 NirD/YgiW/YdeI family stress tolerance protein [Testudinibacter sp. TR-2022]